MHSHEKSTVEKPNTANRTDFRVPITEEPMVEELIADKPNVEKSIVKEPCPVEDAQPAFTSRRSELEHSRGARACT
jgi:hypothetical protein